MVRNNIIGFFVMVMAILGCTFPVYAKRNHDSSKESMFVRAELSNDNPYEGEAVVLTYRLFSKIGNIAYAKRISDPFNPENETSYFSKLASENKWRHERINGTDYVSIPLERYVLTFPKGKFSFKGPVFEIGVNHPVVYDDPFWGRRRGYETVETILESEDIKLKVKGLPSGESNSESSGCVGRFTISSNVPPGDIFVNNPARAIITVKGKGLLDEKVLPMYREAFDGETVRLKSMSEDRKIYFDGTDIITELSLDCEFIPLNVDAEIGKVSFRFFNPESGRHETVETLPVRVIVKSVASKLKPIEV